MPTRPRQHELEDLSRAKFQLAIPRRWVYRDKDKDYGIDGEVELFDESKKAQGLIFYVQLKATESKEKSTILSVDFDIKTLRYYKKLDIPVLLVRYAENEDSIYYKWINNVDLFFAKEKAKTFRVKLQEENRWDSNTPNRIEKRLINIKKFKSGYFNFPIPYTINIKENKIREYSKSIFITSLKRDARRFSDFLEYSKNEDAVIEILLDKEELKINICDLCGCSFHSIDLRNNENFIQGISEDILLGLATSMIQIGQIEYCGHIIFSNNLQKRLLGKKELLTYLLPPLFRSTYFEQILELIGEIMDSDLFFEISVISTVNILISSKSNSQVKINAIEKFFKKSLKNAIENKDNTQIGIAHYNLGNHYRGRGLHLESVRNYISAKRLAPMYLKQHYYFSELAGVLFLSEKFKISSKLYCKSIELGATGITIALYADALMFSGEYEKAKNTFLQYIESCDNPSEEFHLKGICLDTILEEKDIKTQHRRQEEAIIKADMSKFQKGTNYEEQIEKVFDIDLLCGLAWFNLGVLQIKESDYKHALFSFIMAGLVQNNDIEAWENATLCSFNEKKQLGIIPLIIRTAYFFNGDEYLEALYAHLERNNNSTDITQIVEMIEVILPKKDKINMPPTVRMLNKNGKFENIFEK